MVTVVHWAFPFWHRGHLKLRLQSIQRSAPWMKSAGVAGGSFRSRQ